MTNPTAAETPGPFQPGEWAADLAACTASFTVRNFGLRFVTGKIPLTRASVTVDRSGQPVSIRAELDPRGIDTGNRRRDSDLRATARLDRRSAGVSAAPAFLIGHTISLSLAVRLRPPAPLPGITGRQAPGSKAPAKEGHR